MSLGRGSGPRQPNLTFVFSETACEEVDRRDLSELHASSKLAFPAELGVLHTSENDVPARSETTGELDRSQNLDAGVGKPASSQNC